MQVYPPSHMLPEESLETLIPRPQQETDEAVTDATFVQYITTLIDSYRETLERFFASIARHLGFYSCYPFTTYIVRFGPCGAIIGHTPSSESSVKIMQPEDFKPPLEQLNVFDIWQRLEAPFGSFSFSARPYSVSEAQAEGVRRALHDALALFWKVVEPEAFVELCTELLKAEDISLENAAPDSRHDVGYDAVGNMLFDEPAGFRRIERWAFQYKHHADDRVSAQHLRELEQLVSRDDDGGFDVLCLVTSGDLTSIGNYIAVKNPCLRVWDRSVLNRLVNKHLGILEPYFASYKVAVDMLSQESAPVCQVVDSGTPGHTRLDQYVAKLKACPSGHHHFADYEKLGTEIWSYVFGDTLGKPRMQSATHDGTQRRDVLFPNKSVGPFFQRIRNRLGADFVIVDFKNHQAPVGPPDIEDAQKYSNKAVGRFVVVVSRAGAANTVEAVQVRLFEQRDIAVIVVSDSQLVEMIARKERGESPEDVLEDLLDELLVRC